MERIFVEILNMSISSCILIAAVIIIRLIFRRAPKAFFCILWAFVGFKLICPLTFQSTVCLIPDTQQIVNEVFDQKTVSIKTAQSDKEDKNHKIQTPESREQFELPVQNSTEAIQNNTEVKKYEEQTDQYISDSSEITESVVSSNVTIQTSTVEERNNFLLLLPYIWISVAAFMFVGAMIRYILLVRRLHGIDADEKGIYYSDRVDTPFILGVFFPKIYLPYGTKESDKEYIIAHEYTHLHRLDHVWKPIGFAILCLHWFNPMVWVAFHLLCKDIELACDESVVRSYSLEKRKEYSHALINCSESKKALSYVPLAFGESGVKERVINVLSYKKPALWVILICILTVVGISVFLMTNPKEKSDTSILSDEEKTRMIEERKEQRRKYGGMTTEEELLAKGEYSMLEEIENAKKEANATKEGREEQKNVEELLSYYNELDYENEKAVFTLLKDSEKYPNGYDKERFLKDEDYYLECICEVCRMFCQEESNLTSDEKNQIKDYLDTAYNDIVHWYPQSEKSKETYELIEDALDMEYVIRMVTEKPLTFGGFKRCKEG